MIVKKLPTTTWLLLFTVCSPLGSHNAGINLSLPFMFFLLMLRMDRLSHGLTSPLIDRLLSFLKFQFDPSGFVIDFTVTRQAHLLAGRLGGQFGFQLAK